MKRLLLFVLIIMGFCGRFASDAKRCPVAQVVVEPVEPLLVRPVQDDMQCRLWVDSVLDRLSLKERVGQLFIYTIAPHQDKSNRELLRKVIEDYKVGGLLFSGGLMQNQVVLTNEAQRMADIPLLITFDGEWGLSMRLRDTPAFPKNMVLGCIQNDSLLYEYGCEMARQCKELGVQVNFAPVADVNINPKNPVINTRSFGEDPVNVANKVIAYARGLEDGGVLSVAKHFPGHGDTDVDSHKALPVLTFTRERLDSVELYPFKKVIEEGLGGIMVGHLELFFDDDWVSKYRIISYGHDIEASWLIHEAALVLGDKALLEKVEPLVEYIAAAADEGLTSEGGMIYETFPDKGTTDRDCHWWVQAENVVGHINLYQHFDDEVALQKASRCWEYIKKHLIDYKNGEWYWSVRADGTVNTADDKAGFWKCPYHNGRMCMEMIERFS